MKTGSKLSVLNTCVAQAKLHLWPTTSTKLARSLKSRRLDFALCCLQFLEAFFSLLVSLLLLNSTSSSSAMLKR